MVLVKTSQPFTELTNTREITARLKLEFALNSERFPPSYCQKVNQGINSLMFQLSCSYLSYESVKYSFNITLLEWKAVLLLPYSYCYCYFMIFALLHYF